MQPPMLLLKDRVEDLVRSVETVFSDARVVLARYGIRY